MDKPHNIVSFLEEQRKLGEVPIRKRGMWNNEYIEHLKSKFRNSNNIDRFSCKVNIY